VPVSTPGSCSDRQKEELRVPVSTPRKLPGHMHGDLPPTTLPELNIDALDAVVQHLSPMDVVRLRCTCRTLSEAAEPRHPSWALLRTDVQTSGWCVARRSAAERGDVQALRWVGAQGTDLTPACFSAARSGHVPLLIWLRANTPAGARDAYLFSEAARGGRIEALQALRAETPACPWSESACAAAAMGGHLEVLRWLRSRTPPCPWDTSACLGAAVFGHLVALRWLRKQTPPCPWVPNLCLEAAQEEGLTDVVGWIREELFSTAMTGMALDG